MLGKAISGGIASARDRIARGLVCAGVSPNALTAAGAVLTTGAGVCLALGATSRPGGALEPLAEASAWPLLAGALLLMSFACDMLDGAVARVGGLRTDFGAFLDSTLDRCSDLAIYTGLIVHFAWTSPANVTFILLCLIAVANAYLISYTRARAEDLIDRCRVGYWQRGERSAAILIAVLAHNIPALLVQQALLPMMTVLRRVSHTRSVLAGGHPVEDPRSRRGWGRLRLHDWPRATLPYDLVTGAHIAWLLLVRFPPVDILRLAGNG
jgi:CDP-diacylglycerol--glycerol-3-phosphate 3-phosphatidyltransferase